MLVRWEGIDPETKARWRDSWEPRSNLRRAEKNDASLAAKIANMVSSLSPTELTEPTH